MEHIEQAVEQFLRVGYAQLDLPETAGWIPTNLELFTRLLDDNLPPPLCFDDEGNPTNPDLAIANIGLMHRTGAESPDGTFYDRKVLLHTPAFGRLGLILRRHNPIFLSKHGELIDHDRLFHLWCQKQMVEFASALDKQARGVLNLATKVGIEDDRLRKLAYTGLRHPQSDEIGLAHYDKCGLTLALYESAPGLEFLIDGRWVPISSQPGRPVIFAGLKLEQLTHGRVKAVKHRVRRVTEKQYNERVLRIAIVFFAHIEGVELTLRTH